MANNFCRFLSNGYRFNSDGVGLTYSPCCWFSRTIDMVDNPNFDQEKQEISKVTDWIPECQSCRSIEESGAYGKKSPRLRSFEEIPNDDIPDNVPGWVELTIDTTCNAACIICGPWHSTTWRKQEVKFGLKTLDDLPDLVDPLHWLDLIKSKVSLNFVKSVSFLGGEPFESPVPAEFLKLLKHTHGTLEDVTVHFQTNGSIKPSDEVLELIKECKRFKVNLSIDGVGKRLEYIRYPLQWHRIENTIDYLKSQNLNNLRFVCLSTVNPFNIYYYDELENWILNTFGQDSLKILTPNRCVGQLDLAQTPVDLRKEIVQKFGTGHPVTKLISNIPLWTPDRGIEYLDWLDQKRNTSWTNTFPDIVKYFN